MKRAGQLVKPSTRVRELFDILDQNGAQVLRIGGLSHVIVVAVGKKRDSLDRWFARAVRADPERGDR